MKEYNVDLPVVGILRVTVEAESEKDAIQKAFESDDVTMENIDEWDVYEKVVEGNIYYATYSEAQAFEA